MPDHSVTVATFADPTEADLVKSRLEAAGVPVLLSGEMEVTTFAGIGDMVGGIRLQVPEERADQAREILAAYKEEVISRKRASGVPVTPSGRTAWICPHCGAAVDRLIELCPSCGTIMPTGEPAPPAAPAAPEPAADEEKAEPPTAVGDRLAHRAFMAAVFGLFICPGVLHVYSAWVLWKLPGLKAASPRPADGRRTWPRSSTCRS